MQRYVDFWQVTQDSLDYALDSHGIDDIILRQDILNAYQELACYQEVPETLLNLKELGLGTAILSNGAPKMLEAGVRNCNLEEFLDSVFLLIQLEFSNQRRKYINWPQINLDALLKKYCSFPPTPGMFPGPPLLAFRLSGLIVLGKRRSGFLGRLFLKSKLWMPF